MGYQSKTYSLSDEVVAAIDEAKAKGETPNQLLRRVLLPHQDLDAARKRRYCPNCGVEIKGCVR